MYFGRAVERWKMRKRWFQREFVNAQCMTNGPKIIYIGIDFKMIEATIY